MGIDVSLSLDPLAWGFWNRELETRKTCNICVCAYVTCGLHRVGCRCNPQCVRIGSGAGNVRGVGAMVFARYNSTVSLRRAYSQSRSFVARTTNLLCAESSAEEGRSCGRSEG